MQPCRPSRHTGSSSSFNPHPPLRADATVGLALRQTSQNVVSILTHPYGRMQPSSVASDPLAHVKFQSSPTLTGGCNRSTPAESGPRQRCFNPHPPLRADATPSSATRLSAVIGFQSSPTLTGGCNLRRWRLTRWPMSSFNPHPPLRADATLDHRKPCSRVRPVSILTHPYGRMQPVSRNVWRACRRRFNPHPPLRADATGEAATLAAAIASFNPHPPLRADATDTLRRRLIVSWLFQSSPTLTGGCNTAPTGNSKRASRVSILTHPYGRMQPPRRPHAAGEHKSFNPHPPLRADATASSATRRWGAQEFQSSPTLTGGCNQLSKGS